MLKVKRDRYCAILIFFAFPALTGGHGHWLNMGMDLFDSHCHLQDGRFEGDLVDVLARAVACGITHMVCCGTRPSDWAAVMSLGQGHPEVIPAYGIHPWYVEAATDADWEIRLRELLAMDLRAGVGEIGLDGAVRPRRLEQQQSLFMRQLLMAQEFERPVSIHCRRAWEPLLEVLQKVGPLPQGIVIHAYSGSAELVESLLRLGAFFSFSGSITNPAYAKAGDLVRAVPQDRLLIETDAPDMVPHVLRDCADINEPANLRVVAETVAGFTGRPIEAISALTSANAYRVFLGTQPPALPCVHD